MSKYHTLTFNDISLIDYQCFYDYSQAFRTPTKLMDMFHIEGRNGDLSISQNSYSNITIPFNCHIRKDFNENYYALVNDLTSVEGYGRLETSEEPDIYRLGIFDTNLEPDMWQLNHRGTFTLNFNCKPQKYLKSGEKPIYIDGSAVVLNQTKMDAKPLIEVSGTGTITINDSVLTLDTNTGITTIDCDMQDAYEGTINRNGNLTVVNGFPVLNSGENEVSVSGCTINLIPRWWRL